MMADVKAEWVIAMRPGKLKELKKHPRKNKAVIAFERLKFSVRVKLEHPFRLIKHQFGFVKARYKGLRKNDNQLAMLFTRANLFRVEQMIRGGVAASKMRGKPRKSGGWSKKADFGVNTSEFWSNENFKREQAAYDEGAINGVVSQIDTA